MAVLDEELRLRAKGFPPALAKAVVDPFLYAVGLKTGMVVIFEQAHDLDRGFVGLAGIRSSIPAPTNDVSSGQPFTFDRGLEVCLDAIAWVADAPWGS